MESSLSTIQSLVDQVKKELFSHPDNNNNNVYALVSASAYDTAWLAMVPDSQEPNQPMFQCCLSWVLNNQKEGGFWGEQVNEGDIIGLPTLDALTATLACMVALRTWNLGEDNIRKGLDFIYTKAEIILKKNCHDHLPRWFTISFPAMTELAQQAGLDVAFPRGSTRVLHNISLNRQRILEKENLVDIDSPLLSHLESLRSSAAHVVEEEDVMKHLSEDGSFFQSPSATAYAYMTTGNLQCLKYLKSVVQRCPDGVPVKYPMDEELINLCMVDHVQRLGLAEHFGKEIQHILKQVHSHNSFQQTTDERHNLAAKLFKDALSFRLLRAQGYNVKPCHFDWFLSRADMMDYMERNCENLSSVLYAVYRATDLRFRGEQELDEARSFSRKLLEKSMTSKSTADEFAIFSGLRAVIQHELSHPWISRLDQLDHRMWIEENEVGPLWMGNSSFFRLSRLLNEKLMKLATENYNFRQSIYAKELEELTSWSSRTGFTDIGFGREKTAYCYFAISASSCLPHDSIVRLLISKSAIIITVADDFYDMEGTPSELKLLTEAVQRWDGKNLSGHGKTIFNALDDLVTQTAEKYQEQHGINSLTELRDIWKETFESWMVERTWSDSGYLPAMDEYLNTGIISIAIHTIVLPASCFLCQSSSCPVQKLKPAEYAKITKLLMTAARLLNDTQSYQKEEIDGKMNLVLLHLKENPKSHIHDSIAYMKQILDEKTREFLELVFMEDVDVNGGLHEYDLRTLKSMKQLHLSCMKVFHMFFNSTNLFDTKAELLHEIKRAIFIPIRPQPSDEAPTILLNPPKTPPPMLKLYFSKIVSE